jgi:tetrahydromethanopterin S-methyltransferase subunit G
MTCAREIAQQAVNNVWLNLAQRVATLIGAPIFLAAGVSYMNLRDRMIMAEADLRGAQQRLTSLEIATAANRGELAIQAGNITRLQAQREGDLQIGRRIDDLREDVQRVNARLDAMMTPARRIAP